MDTESSENGNASTAAAAAAAAEQPVQVPTPSREDHIEQILTSWFNEHMNNSPVAKYKEVYDHVRDRLKALRDTLTKEL